MKIIHIVRGSFTPDSLNGVYKVIDSVSQELSKKGVSITVLSVSSKQEIQFTPSGYTHINVLESKSRFFITNEFKSFIDKQDKNTIYHFHSVFIPWFLPAMKYIKRHGCKRIILTPHGQYVNEAMQSSLKKKICFYFLDSNIIDFADRIHIIGNSECNEYIKKNNQNIALIPNGCQNSVHKLVNRNLIFSYLGRLSIKQKGLDILLKAFASYKKQGGSGILRVAGNGPDCFLLKEMVQKEDIKDYVFFTGPVFNDNKWKFLEETAFFLHPSRWDGIPTSCMEAAICNIPLIITKETNLDYYVEKYKSGFIIKSDINDLINKLFLAESLFKDTVKYMEYCNNSSRMIANELNWHNISMRYITELYE